MNYYESVVIDYLRANRSTFVNTEYCIQLNPSDNPDGSGPHWYCDAVALYLGTPRTVFLCEISYATHLDALTKRLKSWHDEWEKVLSALARDSSISEIGASWPVRPWLFVPEALSPLLKKRLEQIAGEQPLKFVPRITALEEVQPWRYRSWNRIEKASSGELA